MRIRTIIRALKTAPGGKGRLAVTIAIAMVASPRLSAQTGVNLTELTKLAKKRADELRPALVGKLAPHIKILEKPYKSEFVAIERRIEEVVKLGDSVIPLLLEKLQPSSGGPKSRNLAANCARILARMETVDFLDALIEIANGEDYTGRGHAIPLLAETGSTRAGDVLTQLLGRIEDAAHIRLTAVALKKLRHGGGALELAKRLPATDGALDRAIVDYLEVVQNPVVVPEVLRSLESIKNIAMTMRYIRLLGKCARQDATAAHALLPYLDNKKYDLPYLTEVVDILATVAPKRDKKTIARLGLITATDDPESFHIRAAVTLKILGDTSGPQALKKTLLRLTTRRKKDPLVFSNFADYCMEFGDYKRAAHNYTQAAKYTTSPSVRSNHWLMVARAQARRPNRSAEVRNALKDSGATVEGILEQAAEDPYLAKALKTPIVKKWMSSFR